MILSRPMRGMALLCDVPHVAQQSPSLPLLTLAQQVHIQGAQHDRDGLITQQAALAARLPLIASIPGHGLESALLVKLVCTCMPSLPEMPTPTWAAWIMGTSLAPSPIASVTSPTPRRTSLSSSSPVSRPVTKPHWVAGEAHRPCVSQQPLLLC